MALSTPGNRLRYFTDGATLVNVNVATNAKSRLPKGPVPKGPVSKPNRTSASRVADVSIGVRELKNQLSFYLQRVQDGEDITVTEHGHPIARLTGVTPDVDHMDALLRSGIVEPPRSSGRRLPHARIKPGSRNNRSVFAPGEVNAIVVEQRR
jgi:prevent-host-death family protein